MPRGSALQSLITLFGRFRTLITLLVIGSLLATATAFMVVTSREVTRSTLEQGDAEACNILRVIMLNLEDHKVGLDFFREYARQRHEQQLRDLVSLVVSQVDYFRTLQERGLLSGEQARRAALETVQRSRYGNNDYFFIYDRRNVAISHADPRIRGRDMSNAKDSQGRPVNKAMWEMTRERPDGFLTIAWTRLGEEKPVPKLLYFRHYPQWDWMIGSGVYIDDIDRDVEKKKAEILAVLQQAFSKVRVAETGYFFLFDGQGRILIHPSLAHSDGSLLRDPTTGKQHLQNLMNASRTPAVPLKYLWDKPSSPGEYLYQKYSHVEHFAPFDWYVSSSVYQDEMERPAARILRRQTLFVGGILLFSIIAVFLLVARVTSPLARLTCHAEQLDTSGFCPPESERRGLRAIRFPHEIAHLAWAFLNMEERLDEYLKNIRETTAARERMASELRIARDIQMSMLPDRQGILREQPGIDLAALLEPAREVGGDLYDFFMIAPQRLCFLVGDVSDKGIPAALFMARGKATLRSAARRSGATPDSILAEANRELVEGNELMMFITVFLGILDLQTGELAISNAGHVPPVLLGGDGGCRWLEVPPGKPLGITEKAMFTSGSHCLKAEDALLVMTDGVTEAQNQNDEFYGSQRPLESLNKREVSGNADSVISGLLQDVRTFAGGAPQSDDIAMLCIRYRQALDHDKT